MESIVVRDPAGDAAESTRGPSRRVTPVSSHFVVQYDPAAEGGERSWRDVFVSLLNDVTVLFGGLACVFGVICLVVSIVQYRSPNAPQGAVLGVAIIGMAVAWFGITGRIIKRLKAK